VKNTFLEVVSVDTDELTDADRRHSAPEISLKLGDESASRAPEAFTMKLPTDVEEVQPNMEKIVRRGGRARTEPKGSLSFELVRRISDASTAAPLTDEESLTSLPPLVRKGARARTEPKCSTIPCSGQQAPRRLRPCKGKRERHNRFLNRLMKQIDADPVNFDFDGISWPPTLWEDDFAKKEVIETLEAHKTKVQEMLLSSGHEDIMVLSLSKLIGC
jgi:hypothetical protein